jgi:putative oxidoreductase
MMRLSPKAAWAISIPLALFFVAQGLLKFWGPASGHWADRFAGWGYPAGSHYVVGAIEILGALALLLPRIRIFAAGALILVMAGAFCTHLVHREFPRTIPPLVLGFLAYLVLFSGRAKEQQKQAE